MIEYIEMINHILSKGKWKDNRTGIRCLTVPHYHFSFDMSTDKFPLCTTRKLPIRSTAVELEGFLRGITDKNWYKERKCKYWDYWANPIAVQNEVSQQESILTQYNNDFNTGVIPDKKHIQEKENDLGPIYGYQWRSFNKTYPGQNEDDGDFHNYSDQIATILRSLKNNPNDRRMVCSSWNPNQQYMMALPPCHILHHLTVIDDELNLCWFQRSNDAVCGISQNITSYAMLLLLYCRYSGLKPGRLSGFLSDLHIYENHVEGVKEQVGREPRELPELDICHNEPFSFEDDKLQINWTYKDIALLNYDPHPPIKFDVAV